MTFSVAGLLAGVSTLFVQQPLWLYLFGALVGLVVGSFLNVVIHRLPLILEREWKRQCQALLDGPKEIEEPEPVFNLVTPRSQCPHCGHRIKAQENIPIVSFLWLRGKCAGCGRAISWRYPLVELLTAAISVLVLWRFGFQPAAGAALLLSWALVALSLIDLKDQLLPDSITLPFVWVGLAFNSFRLFTDLQSAVIGAIAGYISLWLVFQAFKRITGKEGMGYGDFKLFALCGAWLGWQQLPVVILLASLVGAVVGLSLILFGGRSRQLPIPFGPFLCAACLIVLLWGAQILHAYLQFARVID